MRDYQVHSSRPPINGSVAFDVSGLNIHKSGIQYYQVTLTNQKNSATFTMPIIMGENPLKAEWINGTTEETKDKTIKVGTNFDPFEDVKFMYDESDVTHEVSVTSSPEFDKNKPGNYTFTYTITKDGILLEVTRVITVKANAGTGGSTGGNTGGNNGGNNGGETVNQTQTVWRVYNKNNGDHLFTTNKAEYDYLVSLGWQGEGTAFTAAKSGIAVYRLYNPNTGEHFYTKNKAEYDNVMNAGWTGEGTAFYTVDEKTPNSKPIYRAFNPNATGPGSHMFTTNVSEYNKLESLGWKAEGVAFHSVN